jgi:hypothetical protein
VNVHLNFEALNKTQPIDSVDRETVEVKGAIVPPMTIKEHGISSYSPTCDLVLPIRG